MVRMNHEQAQAHLRDLIDRALAGEEVLIQGPDRLAVRLVPVAQPTGRRELGRDAGLFDVPDDFDATSAEIEGLFEAGDGS